MGAPAVIARLRLVHPFPSLINTALVFGLATVAGASLVRAGLLAAAMLGLQFCIGTVNDLFDDRLDAASKPWKPVPAGLIGRQLAKGVAIVCGGGALVLAAAAGPAELLMAAAMLGCGLVYDAWLKRTSWSWLCFSIAFAILPVYAWYGAVAVLPPRVEFLVPLAALAGPLIQLSNGLADLERDSSAGLVTPATRLGRRGALLVVAALLALIHGLAWLTLPGAAPAATVLAAAATSLAVVGFLFSGARSPARREAGWMIQAGSLALLGLAWLSAVSA